MFDRPQKSKQNKLVARNSHSHICKAQTVVDSDLRAVSFGSSNDTKNDHRIGEYETGIELCCGSQMR